MSDTEPSEFAIQTLGLPTYSQLKERTAELEAVLKDMCVHWKFFIGRDWRNYDMGDLVQKAESLLEKR